MSLNSLRIDCGLEYKIIKTLDAEERTTNEEEATDGGHAVYWGDDTDACREDTSHQWTCVWYDVHDAHNQSYEQSVVGLHAEEYHYRRDYHHQNQTLGQNSRKVAREKHCD